MLLPVASCVGYNLSSAHINSSESKTDPTKLISTINMHPQLVNHA
jgi:hypothetical protein